MKQKQIIEGNKLIAKFMGYDYVEIGYYGSDDETEWQRKYEKWKDRVGMHSVGEYIVNIKKYKWHEWRKVAYNSSWDWLMPVVEKICPNKRGKDTNPVMITIMPFCNGCKMQYNWRLPSFVENMCDRIEITREPTLLIATWKVVVKYIKWYNNQ